MILTEHDKRQAGLTRVVVPYGKYNISELARQAGISSNIVHSRLNRGWSLEEALNQRGTK